MVSPQHWSKHANITAEGRPYLGAAIRTTLYVADYVVGKVNLWIEGLAAIARLQHTAFAEISLKSKAIISTKDTLIEQSCITTFNERFRIGFCSGDSNWCILLSVHRAWLFTSPNSFS